MEARIIAKEPTVTRKMPYDTTLVKEAAEAYFQRDKFASIFVDTEDEGDSDIESVFSSDSETSDTDSEEERKRKKRKSKRKRTKSKKELDTLRRQIQELKSSQKQEDTSREFISSKQDSKKKEIDDLVGQLNRMAITDPQYGITYYRAIVLDKKLEKCLRAPQIHAEQPVQILQNPN